MREWLTGIQSPEWYYPDTKEDTRNRQRYSDIRSRYLPHTNVAKWFWIIILAKMPFVGLISLLNFLILYTFGRALWTEDQTVVRQPTHWIKQKQEHAQISMPRVRSEPTVPGVWVGEGSSCLRSRGHCGRQVLLNIVYKFVGNYSIFYL
jgi:hypothetical protein